MQIGAKNIKDLFIVSLIHHYGVKKIVLKKHKFEKTMPFHSIHNKF
jgi:hypothetical protein